jgi:transposase
LLATIPGVGIMAASAIAATVCDPNLFRSGREFAAWLGMTPRQNSSGGKERLGRTSKRGDKYIRYLLVEICRRGQRIGRVVEISAGAVL